MVRTTGPLPEVVGALRRFRAGTSEAAGRHPFASRTRFSPETWYGNETIYSAGTQYTMRERNTMAEEQSPCSGPGCGAMFAFEVIGSELKLTVLHSPFPGPSG